MFLTSEELPHSPPHLIPALSDVKNTSQNQDDSSLTAQIPPAHNPPLPPFLLTSFIHIRPSVPVSFLISLSRHLYPSLPSLFHFFPHSLLTPSPKFRFIHYRFSPFARRLPPSLPPSTASRSISPHIGFTRPALTPFHLPLPPSLWQRRGTIKGSSGCPPLWPHGRWRLHGAMLTGL